MTDQADKTASIEALGDLHAVVAEELTKRIKGGGATAADFSAAIAFLRANDIKAMRAKDTPLDRLGKAVGEAGVELPFEGTQH